MTPQSVPRASPSELALRLNALRGTAAYAAYLVELDAVSVELEALAEELRAVGADLEVEQLSPSEGARLIADLAETRAEAVLVDASRFSGADWALLDRRRSSLAHRGLLVLVTTPTGFEALMRTAPNLASWLGAQVFLHARDDIEMATLRERRLAALRTWAAKSDAEIIEAAEQGVLPREPEYAEWLVLLGRGDLLVAPGGA